MSHATMDHAHASRPSHPSLPHARTRPLCADAGGAPTASVDHVSHNPSVRVDWDTSDEDYQESSDTSD